ncbi:hypothetical protein [Peribacillus frigoritolerans]|uniref:hypothetical protein n=1 Tax=Peribacillus frigoritolerans TaxID=450367 RepID=UPI0023DB835B|nr:hypothetical protein [Peribacillus frigoritolerans]MDF1995795.1 hypothetical protein [Peribacillus frigoritolerans]
MERKMCLYCAKWDNISDMTPLYEQGKERAEYYCERCVTHVKINLRKLPYHHLFTWGTKGQV